MTAARGRTLDLKPWTLPVVVAAILIPVAIGFAAGGPVIGLAVGIALAGAIVLVAAVQRPAGPIESAPAEDRRRHVLVVVSHELDSPAAVEQLKREARLGDGNGDAEVRVLAAAQTSLLDKWATDVEGAREEAQRKLVVSVASLEKAEIGAEASVGAETIVQAVEDELRTFPATEVVLVTGPAGDDADGESAARELAERLPQRFRRIAV